MCVYFCIVIPVSHPTLALMERLGRGRRWEVEDRIPAPSQTATRGLQVPDGSDSCGPNPQGQDHKGPACARTRSGGPAACWQLLSTAEALPPLGGAARHSLLGQTDGGSEAAGRDSLWRKCALAIGLALRPHLATPIKEL